MSELDVRAQFVLAGLVFGVLYGAVAQPTRFCVRRGLSDLAEGKGDQTLTAWFAALLVALPMTQWMMLDGHLSTEGMVYFPASLSIWTTVLGAVIFGAGMMMTRGCPARLLVLAGTGNLRAWFGLFVIGVSAYAMFKGLAAETRVGLQATGALAWSTESILLGVESMAVILIAAVAVLLAFFTFRYGITREVLGGLLVGALVAGAWSVTSVLGADDFDPMAAMSFSFVVPIGDAMTYLQLASGLEPNFNVTLVLGVLIGAFVVSVIRGEFALQTFESAADHGRYFLGAAMMGVGGVLALGCTTGQAITGLSTGSVWSVLVTVVIFASGYLTHKLWTGRSH